MHSLSKCIKMADYLKIKTFKFSCNAIFNEYIDFRWDEAFIIWNKTENNFKLYACSEHPHNGSIINEKSFIISDDDKNYKEMIKSLYKSLNNTFINICKIELHEKMLKEYIDNILK